MLVALTVSWPLVVSVAGVFEDNRIRFPLASSVAERFPPLNNRSASPLEPTITFAVAVVDGSLKSIREELLAEVLSSLAAINAVVET